MIKPHVVGARPTPKGFDLIIVEKPSDEPKVYEVKDGQMKHLVMTYLDKALKG